MDISDEKKDETSEAENNSDGQSPTKVRVVDTPEPRKPARKILEAQITEGLASIERSTSGLIIAGLSAGLDLGFSVFLMGTIMSMESTQIPMLVRELAVAAAYSIGFIFVIMGRSELFTEHTTLAILPVLNGRANILQLLRLWGLVYVANIVGGGLFAVLATAIGPAMGVIKLTAFYEIAHPVIAHPWWVILLSGVLAGWLMGLISWLVAASRDTVSQILLILLVTTTIGLAHLHHSMAGSIEVLAGVLSGTGISLADYGHFLLWATLGNVVGGTVFVGLIKYGHVVRSSADRPDVDLEEAS